jgi:formyl-CoA transferase
MQSVFPRLSKTPGSVRTIAPQSPGEDNEQVYGKLLGLDRTQLEELRAREVI